MKRTISAFAVGLGLSLSFPLLANDVELSAEARLNTIMQSHLKKSVSVKQVLDSKIYTVAFDDKVLFTDETGAVLIDGRVLSLADNVVVSNVIKEEYKALHRKRQIIDNSKLGSTADFISQPNDSKFASPSNPERITKKTELLTQPPANSVISNAKTQPPEVEHRVRSKEERECLALVSEANDLGELYSVFESLSDSKAKFCGKTMAGAILPRKPDSEFIVYPAKDEKTVVTMISDYTCSYCQRDFKHIEQLNEQGITVRVAPFGRGDYREIEKKPDGSLGYSKESTTLGHNYAALQCGDESVSGKNGFEMLMKNPNKFASMRLAPDANFDEACSAGVLRDKLVYDVYTQRGTPVYVFDDGSATRSALSVREVVNQALK